MYFLLAIFFLLCQQMSQPFKICPIHFRGFSCRYNLPWQKARGAWLKESNKHQKAFEKITHSFSLSHVKFTYVCVCVCMCRHVWVHACMHVFMWLCMCLCMCVCMHVCVCACQCLYVSMYVCLHEGMCVWVCVHAHMQVCIHASICMSECTTIKVYISSGYGHNAFHQLGTLSDNVYVSQQFSPVVCVRLCTMMYDDRPTNKFPHFEVSVVKSEHCTPITPNIQFWQHSFCLI